MLRKLALSHCVWSVLCCVLIALGSGTVRAQAPIVSNVSPLVSRPGDIITITGSHFNDTAGRNVVFFGATKGTVLTATSTSLTVMADTSATYDVVTVLNLTTGLYGASKSKYTQNYRNSWFVQDTFSFKGGYNYNTAGRGPYNLAVSDLNSDGKPDVVVINKGAVANTGSIVVFQNFSSPGRIDDTSVRLVLTVDTSRAYPTNVKVADMNNDGKKDIIITQRGTPVQAICVYLNTSTGRTISFGARRAFSIDPYAAAELCQIADYDLDGLPDIALTAFLSDRLIVLRNTSSGGGLSFDTTSFPTGATPLGLTGADFNNDGRADLVSVDTTARKLSIFRNTSRSGTIAFAIDSVSTPGQCLDAITMDADNDGKQDIVLSEGRFADSISIYRNTTSDTLISFATPERYFTGVSPTGMAAGDIDGDGRPDLAIAAQADGVQLFRNNGIAGTLTASSLADSVFLGGLGYLNVAIADMDGDKYADVLAVNPALPFMAGTGTMYLSIFRNYPKPKINLTTGRSRMCFRRDTALMRNAISRNIYPNTDTTGGFWSVTNTRIATINDTGLVTSLAPGLDTIVFMKVAGGDTSITMKTLLVDSVARVFAIAGDTDICLSATTTLTNIAPGGVWSSSRPTVASINATTGLMRGNSAGSATISYTLTNTCNADTAKVTALIAPPAAVSPIGGPDSVCVGYSITLTDTARTGGTGTWTSLNPSVATVSAAGEVYGLVNDTVTIKFTFTNACNTASTAKRVRIGVGALVPAITGASSICERATVALSNPTSGGVWTSSNVSIATVNFSTGLVTGTGGGNAIITYTVANACGTGLDTALVPVIALPSAGIISGSTRLCGSGNTLLSSTVIGGTWSSSSTAVATISTSGRVFALSIGSTTISYQVTNSCGSAIATYAFRVDSAAYAGTISGPTNVCPGDSILYTAALSGGTWRTLNPSVATVSAAGRVRGITVGTTTLVYKMNNSCGSDSAIATINVPSRPTLRGISGASAICIASSTTLADTPAGGVWSIASPAIATITAAGVVTGRARGTTVVSYTLTNSCGTSVDTFSIRVDSAAFTTVIYASALCLGDTTRVVGLPPGAFSASTPTIASISSSGLVSPLRRGMASFVFTFTNACGSFPQGFNIRIDSTPIAGTITGASSVCLGNTVRLSDTASGGVWSSSNALVASVSTSGVVFGRSAGAAVISYTVTNSCGSFAATMPFSVISTTSSGSISGRDTVCLASSIALTSTTAGVRWSSSAPSIASVSATGVVSGVAAGTVLISALDTGACASAPATRNITVLGAPALPTVSGGTAVCVGGNIIYTASSSRGRWALAGDNSSIAATGTTTITIRGTSIGADTLLYVDTNLCGSTSSAPRVFSVVSSARAGVILGPTVLCANESITLVATNASAVGSWSSVPATGIITINSVTGVVFGINPGTATIRYIVSTSSCGSDTAYHNVFVNARPSAGRITGLDTICAGSTTVIRGSGTGDYWSVSDTLLASVATSTAATATILGRAEGVVQVYYIDTNSCGKDTARLALFLKPAPPVVAPITGPSSICLGTSATFADSTTGGVWSSNSPTTASISSTGTVFGGTAGQAVVTYAVTNACTTTSVAKNVRVSGYTRLTSPLTANTCDSALFTYTPVLDSARGTYAWSRATAVGIANAADSGTATIAERLDNLNNTPQTAVYAFTTTVNGCSQQQNVTVTVNPTPRISSTTKLQVCSGSGFTYTPVFTTGAGTTGVWTRAAVAGILPATATGVTTIIDTLNSSVLTNTDVLYTYTATYAGCSTTESITITVFPSAATPKITTRSPFDVCNNTQFQNFGAATAPPAGITYFWTTTAGASVFTTGNTRQYCLVNFNGDEPVWVKLTTSLTGSSCPSGDSVLINIGPKDNHTPEVTYFDGDLVCLMSDADSYQWGYDDIRTLDSTLYPGETNQNLTMGVLDLRNKLYWVITTKNGCEQKSYYRQPQSIINNSRSEVGSMTIAPNPTQSALTVSVRTTTTTEAKLDIINAIGQVVYTANFQTNTDQHLQLRVPAGIYQVRAHTDGEIFTSKLVITE